VNKSKKININYGHDHERKRIIEADKKRGMGVGSEPARGARWIS
jgi:uncharacterized protein (DUF302 family)